MRIYWIRSMMAGALLLMFTACGGGGAGLSDEQKALNMIVEYADKGENPPTLETYVTLKITGVNGGNLDAINILIAGKIPSQVDSREEIQQIVDGYQTPDEVYGKKGTHEISRYVEQATGDSIVYYPSDIATMLPKIIGRILTSS